MKKVIAIITIAFLMTPYLLNAYDYGILTPFEKKVVTFGDNSCQNIDETDIPTIFVPGILASWYSQEGFDETQVKRWIPDPITHVYDPLFFTFKNAGYTIEDVFYKDEFNLYIEGNPKNSLYLFGYDWKKDNKITATLLTQLIGLILKQYEKDNGCNIGKVNLIGHSMGGLVARSMLEDMCVKYEDKSYEGNMKIDGYDFNPKNGKIEPFLQTPCKNPFSSSTISENIKVNKFITISTPHRGAPKSLAIWEKGDIEMTDGFMPGKVLKSQSGLGFLSTDGSFYNTLHGYNEKIPNGIISVGQLLPDIKNKNSYNENLKYLYKTYPKIVGNNLISSKSKYYLDNEFYPVNSFLEELNKKENIDKMWEKISDNYTSYYSVVTGNNGSNNIVEFDISDETLTLYNGYKYETRVTEADNTYNIGKDVKDIYDDYELAKDRFKNDYYNIKEIVRDNFGLGGDGTVPTYNLKLVANDSKTGEEIKNNKFKSVKIDCFDNSKEGLDYLKENLRFLANPTYKNFGKIDFEICSHTNMPIATSKQVLNEIIGLEKPNSTKEYLSILSNLGYTKYKKIDTIRYVTEKYGPGSSVDNLYDYNYEIDYYSGIKNSNYLDRYFEKDKFILTDVDIKNNKIIYSLNMGALYDSGIRVFRYEVLSPINLLITDSQGRSIGIDPETGMIINEIPGAWTSGDTEGSNEPEFFMIPVVGTGAVEHKIKTYGTGKGEYHIVLNDVYLGGDPESSSGGQSTSSGGQSTSSGGQSTSSGGEIQKSEKMIIAGNAKKAFGEDYVVNVSKAGEKSFKNLTENINPSIEIKTTNIKTIKNNYRLRYNIRGDSKDIGFLRYKLFRDPESSSGGQSASSGGQSASSGGQSTSLEGYNIEKDGKLLLEEQIEINGILDINLKENGIYSLKMELVDEKGNKLSENGINKLIKIEKSEKIETLTDKIAKSKNGLSFTKSMFFPQIFDKNLDKLLNIYNNKENYIDSRVGFGINHSFDFNFEIDNKTKDIKVILPDGKSNIFKQRMNLSYKKEFDNNLELKVNGDYFELHNNNKIYYFSKQTELLEKIIVDKVDIIDIVDKKRIIDNVKYDLFYNRYNKLSEIRLLDKVIFKFLYDKNTYQLSTIVDRFGNRISFNYEKIDGIYLLSRINNEKISYDIAGNIEEIDLLKDLFKTNENYNYKLKIIFEKLDSLKLTRFKKDKLSQSLMDKKDKFLDNIKGDYSKALIGYFLEEIVFYLNK